MTEEIPNEDSEAAEGGTEKRGRHILGPDAEGITNFRAIVLGAAIGAFLWALVGAAIFLLF